MKTFAKFMTGAAAAALVSVSLAAPAQAQFSRYDRYDPYYRAHNRGSVIGDIITGIAVAGGIAAVTSALSRDGYRYGSRDSYRYRDGYRDAVNSCAYEAERYGRGRVRITDVDRRGYDGYRVRGVIEGGYDAYDRGYDRRWDRDYGRYDYDRRDRDSFTCTTYGNGRIADFRLSDRGYAYGW
jgi:hypothetical protein